MHNSFLSHCTHTEKNPRTHTHKCTHTPTHTQTLTEIDTERLVKDYKSQINIKVEKIHTQQLISGYKDQTQLLKGGRSC